MRVSIVLDPYTLKVQILKGGMLHVCSYQEAIDDPKIFDPLPQNVRETIALNVEPTEKTPG